MSTLSNEDSSLASSSVIMPHSAQDRDIMPDAAAIRERAGTVSSVPTTSLTIPSGPSSEDGSSESSASLVDAPASSVSEEDEVAYELSRSQIAPAARQQEIEYVMLYDSSESEEEPEREEERD